MSSGISFERLTRGSSNTTVHDLRPHIHSIRWIDADNVAHIPGRTYSVSFLLQVYVNGEEKCIKWCAAYLSSNTIIYRTFVIVKNITIQY